MAYYEGQTLKEKIKDKRLKINEAIDIAIQITEGLARAHEKGIVHRDIKPANIMITNDGAAKIVDFGLAKLSDHTRLTVDNRVFGTIAYISPEQARGEEVDWRSDIWSLGVLLFEMLTGQLPFESDYDQALIYGILNEDPAPISQYRHDAPEYIPILIRRCLEKDKTQRPQSLQEVSELLRNRGMAKIKLLSLLRNRIGSKRVAVFFVALLFLVAAGWFLIPQIRPPTTSRITKWRVAVLPFHDQTGQTEKNDWPIIIQSLLVGELIGVNELMLIDPLSLNTLIENSFGILQPKRETEFYLTLRNINISFLIDGKILRSGDRYLIQSNIIDPVSREITFSHGVTLESDQDLLPSVRTLSNLILSYFQVKVLSVKSEQDLRPWLKYGSQHMGAIKAFILANQYAYHGERASAEKYLRRAIELDSSFISPRIWLISRLVERKEVQEASEQYHWLQSLQDRASPFEQVMIDWAGACIREDIAAQARYLTIALDYSPQNNILLFSLARLLYILQDYQGSVQALSHIIEMKLHVSPVYYLLGANYYQLGNYKEAEKVLLQSLRIKPVEPNIYLLLARLRCEDSDSTRLLDYENLYIESSREQGIPQHHIFATLARQNYILELYDHSIQYYKMAISWNKDIADYHKGLAQVLYHKGDTLAAINEYLSTLKINANCADSHLMLGQIFEQKKDIARAIYHYQFYLDIDSLGTLATSLSEHLAQLKLSTD